MRKIELMSRRPGPGIVAYKRYSGLQTPHAVQMALVALRREGRIAQAKIDGHVVPDVDLAKWLH